MKFFTVISDSIGDRWRSLPKGAQRALLVLLVAVIAVLPMIQIPLLNTPQTDFPSLLFDKIGLYVLMGIGLNVVVGKDGHNTSITYENIPIPGIKIWLHLYKLPY